MTMTLCEHCGAEVRFVLLGWRPDGGNRWSLPLESTSKTVKEVNKDFELLGYTVTETFRMHDCPEGRAAREERTHAQQVSYARAQERARMTSDAWKAALPNPCPKCGVAEGVHCENLTDRRSGRHRTTAWPHAERLPTAWLEYYTLPTSDG